MRTLLGRLRLRPLLRLGGLHLGADKTHNPSTQPEQRVVVGLAAAWMCRIQCWALQFGNGDEQLGKREFVGAAQDKIASGLESSSGKYGP